jgi:hypothetical protein
MKQVLAALFGNIIRDTAVSPLLQRILALYTWVAANFALKSELDIFAGKLDNKADWEGLEALSTTIAKKADASTVNALSTTIAGKADTSAVNELASTVSYNRDYAQTALTDGLSLKADASAVSALSTAVAGKADASAVTALSTAIDAKASEAALSAIGNLVSAKASQTALDAVESTASTHTTAIAAMQANITGIVKPIFKNIDLSLFTNGIVKITDIMPLLGTIPSAGSVSYSLFVQALGSDKADVYANAAEVTAQNPSDVDMTAQDQLVLNFTDGAFVSSFVQNNTLGETMSALQDVTSAVTSIIAFLGNDYAAFDAQVPA